MAAILKIGLAQYTRENAPGIPERSDALRAFAGGVCEPNLIFLRTQKRLAATIVG